jgi:hypothetical protein
MRFGVFALILLLAPLAAAQPAGKLTFPVSGSVSSR